MKNWSQENALSPSVALAAVPSDAGRYVVDLCSLVGKFFVWSWFCHAVFSALSSFEIISLSKVEVVGLFHMRIQRGGKGSGSPLENDKI